MIRLYCLIIIRYFQKDFVTSKNQEGCYIQLGFQFLSYQSEGNISIGCLLYWCVNWAALMIQKWQSNGVSMWTVSIFPKLPVYLREYHKHRLRNQRIQDAVKNMKSEIEPLEAINKRQGPAEVAPPTGISGIMTEVDDSGGLSADTDVEKNDRWAIAWSGPSAFPSVDARPMQRAIRSLGSSTRRLFVGTEAMGTMYSLANVNRSKKRQNGERGQHDKLENRRKRRCGR
jgi:hypothetical protein